MDKEQIKSRIDFNNIQEKTFDIVPGIFSETIDYLVDFEGNFIIPLSPLEVKLIEEIKSFELRIQELDARLKIQEKK